MKLTIKSGRILALLIVSFLCVGAQEIDKISSQDLSSQELSQKALNAFRNRNLSESQRLYEMLWKKKDTALEDFTRAGRVLAYMEHHFHDNMDGVYPYYNEIIKRNPQKVDLYLRLADFEIQSHRFKQAQETLKRALKEKLSIENQKDIDIRWSKVILEQFIWEKTHRLDLQQLKKELSKIEGYAHQSPENTELAYLQMGFSLILKNITMFWEGWRNYFRLPKDKEARSFLSDSQHYLTLGLDTWESRGVPLDLIKGLVFSRLYDLAMMMVKFDSSNLNKHPYVEKLRHYYQYINQTQDNGFSYYRKKALGNNDFDSFFAKQDKLDLWM